jgi:maltooligosyltrehalose trehalohydrolase
LLAEGKTILARRWDENSEVFAAYHFGEGSPRAQLPIPTGRWARILDSADSKWEGPGSDPESVVCNGRVELRLNPWSIVLYERLDKS